MLLNMGVTFYTSRIVLHVLGVEDYGIYNVVAGVIVLFSFLNTAMASSTQRFLTFELGQSNDICKLKQIFSTSINIHFCIAFSILFLGEAIGVYFLNAYMIIPGDRILAANIVYQCSLISCCLGVIMLPYNAVIISHERMDVFAYISILDVILKLAVALILYMVTYDKLITYSFLILFVSIITSAIYVVYDRVNFQECRYRYIKNITLLKNMCGFAGWNLIGNMAYMGFTQGLNILLNLFFNPAINAARGIAVQLQGAIGQFSRNFQMAINPQIIKKYAVNDLKAMHDLICISSKFSFFLIFLISLPVILQADVVLNWWLTDIPDHTISFFRIIICISMIDVLANPLNISAHATGKIKIYQIFEGGTLLMIVPISYCALCLFPVPEIVFIVHLILALIAQVIRLLLLNKMIHLSIYKYIKEVLCRISLVVFSVIFTLYLLYILQPTWMDSFVLCTSFSIIITFVFIYILGLNALEKKYLLKKSSCIIHNINHKINHGK